MQDTRSTPIFGNEQTFEAAEEIEDIHNAVYFAMIAACTAGSSVISCVDDDQTRILVNGASRTYAVTITVA